MDALVNGVVQGFNFKFLEHKGCGGGGGGEGGEGGGGEHHTQFYIVFRLIIYIPIFLFNQFSLFFSVIL